MKLKSTCHALLHGINGIYKCCMSGCYLFFPKNLSKNKKDQESSDKSYAS